MPTSLSPEKRKDLVADYLTKKYSNQELAKMYVVTSATVRNILIKDGVYIKQRSTENTTWEGRKFNTHETFLERIKVSETGCWEWQRAKDVKGYGKITINGVFWQTHRYAYQYYKGPIGDLYVCHKCDNPSCCNPAHLFLGNASDNALDMIEKGRGGRVKLTREQIFKIREMHQAGVARKQISQSLSVHIRTVDNVVTGKRWSYLSNTIINHEDSKPSTVN